MSAQQAPAPRSQHRGPPPRLVRFGDVLIANTARARVPGTLPWEQAHLPVQVVPHWEHHVSSVCEETCPACSPSCHPGEMIHHPTLATCGNAAERTAATGTFLLIRMVSTFLIKGSLKIISFQYLHMLNRLQRSRHNEVKKERTIKHGGILQGRISLAWWFGAQGG